jgi:serine/threonine-protein kinase SRPK3
LIKADINPSNVILTIADESVLESVESAEAENRLLKKVVDNIRTIYSSHSLGLPKDAIWGEPVLCDFGEACIGKYHKGLIQLELYHATEVLFDMKWSLSVDIWSVAAMVSVLTP